MKDSSLARTIIAIALLLGLSALPMSHSSSNAQGEQIYLALGDSIPAGLLASLPAERGYPAVLRDLIETSRLASGTPGSVELINLAEPGETIDTFVSDGQLDAAIEEIERAPEGSLQTVTLTIGGNNILSLWESTPAEREAQLQEFESEFNDVIEQLETALEGHDADVVVTTYYDLTEGDAGIEGSNAWWLQQFNSVITDTVTDAGFTVVDIEPLFRGRVSELTWFPADIHPNNAGHQAIARAIWHELAYDQEPPAISITRPESPEARSRIPTIYASVEDDVGVERVILEIDGDDSRELIHVPEQDAWIGVWDARDFSGDEGTLGIVATDVSGNESREALTISLPSR